jgi:hypothetical protein
MGWERGRENQDGRGSGRGMEGSGKMVHQDALEVQHYILDPDHPSMMGKARRFLHKQSKQTLESSGAKIPGSDQVRMKEGSRHCRCRLIRIIIFRCMLTWGTILTGQLLKNW